MEVFAKDGRSPSEVLQELVWSVARRVAASDEVAAQVPLAELYEHGIKRVLELVASQRRRGRQVPFRAFATVAMRGMWLGLHGVRPCRHAEALASDISQELEDRWSSHLDTFDLVIGLMEVTDLYLTALLVERAANVYRKRDAPEGQETWGDAVEVVLAALKGLPPIQRQLLWGHYFLAEDLDRVGQRLRIADPDEVRKQHRWALERLRKPLSDVLARQLGG
ncbi:MAG: hypothetical protein ACFCGT_14720 [Sandaracinaceae bacterium]